MPEKDTPKDRATALLQGILGDAQTLSTLLSKSDAREDILDRASNEFAAFNEAETGTFVRLVLGGLAQENEEWDQDRRDGALELLELTDLGKLRPDHLVEDYVAAVATQSEDSDPYGTISGLLDVGEILGRRFTPGDDTRVRVRGVWDNVASKFTNDDRHYIETGRNGVLETIPLQAEDLLGDEIEVNLGRREKPKFEPSEEALQTIYLEATARQKTFKIALWENVPNFRALCQNYGIALERFWNLNNPDEVVKGLEALRVPQFSDAYAHLNRALYTDWNLREEDLTGDLPRVLADEIIQVARHAQQGILDSLGDFDTLVNRFSSVIEEMKGKPPKAHKAIRSQITNFFKENGVELAVTSIEDLIQVLDDSEPLAKARIGFNQKQDGKRQAAQAIEDTFKLREKPADFVLMSRTREDLFLGDVTGDCTAYHLHTGMNAWTLPSWLTNPGFHFYKMPDGDQLIAKAGLILAVADGSPTLVIDSFEVGNGIPSEASAVEKIRDGLRFLRNWAQSIGLSGARVNTISNSSGAVDLLEDIVEVGEPISDLHALGALDGVTELRKRLGDSQNTERTYFQSADKYINDEDEEAVEQSRYIQEFEGVISKTIKKADVEDRIRIEQAARAQDWKELFRYIIKLNYPQIERRFGNDWQSYQRFMETLVVSETGQVHTREYVAYGDDDQGPLAKILDVEQNEEIANAWAIQAERSGIIPDEEEEAMRESIVYMEAVDVDKLLFFLKEMESRKVTPEIALRQLYGQVSLKDSDAIKLNRKLPLLAA